MDVFRFGLHYWKKYIPLSLLSKLFSFLAMLKSDPKRCYEDN